jgi:hypothetical protein
MKSGLRLFSAQPSDPTNQPPLLIDGSNRHSLRTPLIGLFFPVHLFINIPFIRPWSMYAKRLDESIIWNRCSNDRSIHLLGLHYLWLEGLQHKKGLEEELKKIVCTSRPVNRLSRSSSRLRSNRNKVIDTSRVNHWIQSTPWNIKISWSTVHLCFCRTAWKWRRVGRSFHSVICLE